MESLSIKKQSLSSYGFKQLPSPPKEVFVHSPTPNAEGDLVDGLHRDARDANRPDWQGEDSNLLPCLMLWYHLRSVIT